jgi:hypothetical protein
LRKSILVFVSVSGRRRRAEDAALIASTVEKESFWRAKLCNFNMTSHKFDWGLRLRSGPFDWPQLILRDSAPVM